MRGLLALTICFASLGVRAQSSVGIAFHPRLYILLKPLRLYRSADTVTVTSFRLDSGQVVSAKLWSTRWAGISNVNVLAPGQASSITTLPPLIAGEDPLSHFTVRLADLEVALYEPPTSRKKHHRK